MKQSIIAKRMAKSHKKRQDAGLNLTSLMDIFTILVFFLMVNSGDTQVLSNTTDIIMPVSFAEQVPKETLLLQVSGEYIVIQGKRIAEVGDVKKLEDDVIPELDNELRYQASRRPELTDDEKLYGRALTVQGDNHIPYVVLKKIMATAAKAEYRDISLAVTQTQRKAGE